jgi:hypothetical protein
MGERVRILSSTFRSNLQVGERPPAFSWMEYAVDQLTEAEPGYYRFVVHHVDGTSEDLVGHKSRRNVMGRDRDSYSVYWAQPLHPLDGAEIEILGHTWGSWDGLYREISASAAKAIGGEELDKYREAYASIAGLARYIADGPLAEAVRGFMTMEGLNIHQSGMLPRGVGHVLQLTPLESGLVRFRYRDTMIEERQWQRVEPPERVIARFDHFLDQLHWVITERAAV